MRSVMMNYPGFRDLPKGAKKLLLVSETFFFTETRTQAVLPVPNSPGAAMQIERRFTFPPYFPELPDAWNLQSVTSSQHPASARAVHQNS